MPTPEAQRRAARTGTTDGVATNGPGAEPESDHAAASGSGEPDLASMLADAAGHSPALTAVFGSTGRQLLWANDSLRDLLQVPAWAEPPLIELLDDTSQGRFVVKVLPCLLRQGWWQGALTMVGPDVGPVQRAGLAGGPAHLGRRPRRARALGPGGRRGPRSGARPGPGPSSTSPPWWST